MRIPQFERYEKTLTGIGIFLVGLIVGCALFLSIYQHNFSLLSIRNIQMRSEIKDLKEDLADSITLNQNHKKSNKALIRNITITFERKTEANKLDEVSENELHQKITTDLQFLNGTEVSKIKADPLLYRNLLDGKTYHAIQERDYTIFVRAIIAVDDELTIILNVVAVRK